MAGWQSGYAAACKAVYAGSNPTPASNFQCGKMPWPAYFTKDSLLRGNVAKQIGRSAAE
jgi:hypothetical protein